MQGRPFKDQCARTTAHVAFNNLQRIDVHLNLLALVNRMEVRRRMVAIEHANDDPIEATEFRHGGSLSGFRHLASLAHRADNRFL